MGKSVHFVNDRLRDEGPVHRGARDLLLWRVRWSSSSQTRGSSVWHQGCPPHAVKSKIIDIVKDQLTKETVDKLVDIIKDKVDGGPWVDTIIDFIGDRISQALLDQIIDYIENNLLAYNIAEYGAKENFLEGLKKFLDMLPDNILEDIIDKILEG